MAEQRHWFVTAGTVGRRSGGRVLRQCTGNSVARFASLPALRLGGIVPGPGRATKAVQAPGERFIMKALHTITTHTTRQNRFSGTVAAPFLFASGPTPAQFTSHGRYEPKQGAHHNQPCTSRVGALPGDLRFYTPRRVLEQYFTLY